MDNLGAQPHCPNDDVVMRDVAGGYQCPDCGHLQLVQATPMPPAFDGPDIDQRRWPV